MNTTYSTVLVCLNPQLQRSISDKDSAIAMLELQQSSEDLCAPGGLEKLKGERSKLTQQLKRKVQERVDLFRKDSDKALDSLANQFQSYSKEQVRLVLVNRWTCTCVDRSHSHSLALISAIAVMSSINANSVVLD